MDIRPPPPGSPKRGSLEKKYPANQRSQPRSRHTPFHTVKVVIVGQDPYHNVNQAHGLAFSVRPPTPAPPSLRNMYIALKRDYPSFTAPTGNRGLLTPWADRGVLLLNTCLTVRAHEANSHANRGWERFTQRIMDLVAQKRTRGVAFMAWGTPAGKRVVRIDRSRHLVLTAVHPSPLSASRGFFDCGHFRKANDWLVTRYGEGAEVDWDLNEKPEPKPVPAPAKKPVVVVEEKKEEVVKPKAVEEDFDDDEEEMMRATLEAEEAGKNKKKADAEKGGEKKQEDEEKESDVPPAVVVVGEVEEKKDGSGGVQEKSETLEKEGEEDTEKE
jgi:uracil-DNA glycosylase